MNWHRPGTFTAFAALILTCAPARANLIITPTFDSSITGDTNAAAIEASINSAITMFEGTYSNSINVLIYFQEETTGLGGSQFFDYQESYQTFYNKLVAKNANPAAIAGLNASGGHSATNPVTGTSNLEVKSANLRAVGINVAPGCTPTAAAAGSGYSMDCTFGTGGSAVDGIISINTSITYPPGSTSGYGLQSTVEHEIDEILGLGSSLNNISASSGTATYLSGNPAPEDLFRCNSSGGPFTSGVNCASPGNAYFSYAGTIDITQFNNACNGADFGDWVTGTSFQVQDAFGQPGTDPAYGANEIAALSAIGYTVAAPEPATTSLLIVATALLLAAARPVRPLVEARVRK